MDHHCAFMACNHRRNGAAVQILMEVDFSRAFLGSCSGLVDYLGSIQYVFVEIFLVDGCRFFFFRAGRGPVRS